MRKLPEIIAENLRDLLHESRMTQVEWAKRAGIEQPVVNRALNGRIGNTTLKTLEALVKPAGKPVEWLLTDRFGSNLPSKRDQAARAPQEFAPGPGTSPENPEHELESARIREEITSLLPALDYPELLELRAWSRGLARARKFLNNLT